MPPKTRASTPLLSDSGRKYYEMFLEGKIRGAWVGPNEFPTSQTANGAIPAAPTLAETYRYRLPIMNVRQDWPVEHNLDDDHTKSFDTAAIRDEFPGLEPTGRYLVDNRVGGLTWEQHVFEVRSLLIDFSRGAYADNFGLAAMLRSICEGIPSTIVLDRFIEIRGALGDATRWRNHYRAGDNYDTRLIPGARMINATLPDSAYTRRFRNQLYSRRFIVTFFHFSAHTHWVAAVFDRVAATLLIFDTMDDRRRLRSQAAAYAWRSFGANLGFPCDVHAISPPLREQPYAWECGYLGLVNISLCVRSLIGVSVARCLREPGRFLPPVTNEFQQTPVTPGGGYMNLPETPLPIPDWGCGGDSLEEGFLRAKTFLLAMLGNELGFRTNKDMESQLSKLATGNHKKNAFFEFTDGFAGDFYTLRIGKVRGKAWQIGHRCKLPQLFRTGTMLRIGLDDSTRARQQPIGWPPAETTLYPGLLVGGVTTIDQLFRRDIVCWDTNSRNWRSGQQGNP